MADTPLVSVIVPCYNHGRYLGEALRSVGVPAARTEIVVVDDGSRDSTPDVVATFETRNIFRSVRQPNAGLAAARNRGLRESRGEFVVFLDADDRLAPGAIGLLRDALERHPQAGFAYGHQRFFGDWRGEMRFPAYDPLRLLDRHLIGPTALVRREVLDDTGGYDESFALYEDWELWIAALAHGWHGVRVDAITHEYRRHGPSKLADDRRRYRELRRQLRAKHAALYADRRALREHSPLGPAGRIVYRWFWGPRPVPAVVEAAVYSLLWRRRQSPG